MATVLRRALADRERPPRRDVLVRVDGLELWIRRGKVAAILDRVQRRRGPHNGKRRTVERSLLDHLLARYKAALVQAHDGVLGVHHDDDLDGAVHDAAVAAALARGEHPPPEWEAEIRARLRRLPEVRAVLDRCWPVLSGAELVHDLFSFAPLVDHATDGVLPAADAGRLVRPRAATLREVPWTEADVALIDEADALVGPVELARPRRARGRSAEERELLAAATSAADVVARYHGGSGGGGGDEVPELRTFGHIVVDEAQDLTPMQWRMLARRAPNGSLTLVGDFGQASRPGAARGWDEVLSLLPHRQDPTHVTLTVNYRTPAEIMDLANRLLAVVAPGVEPTRAVRATGDVPRLVEADDPLGVSIAEARAAAGRGGSVAVIAPEPMRAAIAAELADLGALHDVPEVLDAPIAVVDPTAAKGLEFDHVVVVEPDDLVEPGVPGLRLLYVTLSRATRTLTVVHGGRLPAALTSAGTH